MVTNILNFNNKPYFGQPFESSHWARQGLVFHVPFIRFGNLIDVSGNGNHGNIIDGAIWAMGRNGRAISFNGTDGYVSITDNPSLNFTGDFTLLVWIKHSGEAEAPVGDGWRIITKQEVDSSDLYLLRVNDSSGGTNGEVTLQIRESGGTVYTVESNTLVKDGEWYFVVAIREGSDLKMYINGILENTTASVTTNAIAPVRDLEIGRWKPSEAANEFWNGLMDDIRIYNRALLASKVAELYYNEYPEYYTDIPWLGRVAAVGRTTKNTDAYPLGVNVGMSWRMPSNYL